MTSSTKQLVGRADEFQQVIEALSGPPIGAGARVVYVDGPAGIGKTWLIDAVAAQWRAAGGDVRWSRCWNGPGTPPLWPWTHVLQLADRSAHGRGVRTTSRGIGGLVVESPGGRSADLARFELFTEIVDDLVDRSERTSLLVVIDDLHWADVATVELLDFVMRDPRADGVRIVVTSRTPEADIAGHHAELAAIASQAQRLTLTGLGSADVVELGARYSVSTSVAQSVFERTDGNPLFVTELFRLGQTDGASVPTSLGAVIGRHLGLLGDQTRRVLQLAAVQGQVFDIDVLRAAGRLDGSELEAMLDAARRFQLVQQRGATWMFTHALVGDALVDAIPFDQRCSDHLATADAIERVHGADRDDLAGTICSHLDRAGASCPADRLVATARRAARHAASQLAWSAQAQWLATAVDASRASEESDRRLIELLIDKCQAEKSARLLESATTTARELARLARSIDDPVLLARVALVYPPDSEGIEIDEIHDPEQVRIRTEALAALPGDETGLRIQLQASLALSLYWEPSSGDRAESHQRSAARREELTRTALSDARDLGDPAVLACALDARIHATWGPETADERPALAAELHEVALGLGDARRVLAARVWKVAELLERLQLDEADRQIASFEADVRRINDRVGMWTALRWRSNRAFISGDLTTAEALAGEALTVALQFLPEHISMSFYVTMLGPIHYVQGTLGHDLDTVLAIADESPDVPAWLVGAATAMSEIGDLDEARRRLRRLAADDFAMLPRDLNFFGAMVMLALTSFNVGDAEVAAAVRRHIEERSGRYAIHGTGYTSYGPVDLALAQCLHTMGDIEGARRHYETAIEAGDRVGTPYADVARLHLGTLLLSHDHRRAHVLLHDVLDRFEQRGLDEMAARVTELLDALDAARTVALREHAGGWSLHLPGAAGVDLGDLKGTRALRELVLRPQVAHHVLALTRVIERDTGDAVVVNDLAIARLDDQAIKTYRARVEELREALDLADRRGDVSSSASLQVELDALLAELAENDGFAGRSRSDPTAADRARVNITKHLKRAIERIAAVDATVGEHLRAAVSTGMYCSYEPVPGDELHWTT